MSASNETARRVAARYYGAAAATGGLASALAKIIKDSSSWASTFLKVKTARGDKLVVEAPTLNVHLDRVEITGLKGSKAQYKLFMKNGDSGWAWDGHGDPPEFQNTPGANAIRLDVLGDPSVGPDKFRYAANELLGTFEAVIKKAGFVFDKHTNKRLYIDEWRELDKARKRTEAARGDMKKTLEKLVQDARKDLDKFAASLSPYRVSTGVRFESHEGRGGNGPYELATIYIGGFQATIVGDPSDDTVSIGASSGPHSLEGLGTDGMPVSRAAAGLKRVLDWFKESIARDAAKENAAPKSSPLDDVSRLLKSMKLGPAGRAQRVDRESETEWTIEPSDRARLDHYGNGGDGWDEEGWEEDYAGPTYNVVQKRLDQEFGAGTFSVEIGEKGHIDVQLTPKGRTVFEVSKV